MRSYPDVDTYLEESGQWPDEVAALRPLLLASGLTEEIKWASPCYSHDGANVALVQEFKDFLALMFFKGALLEDPDGVLEDQGPNSRSARRMRFTSIDDVNRLAHTIEAYLEEAIDVEARGLEVEVESELAPVEELRERLGQDPALKAAFEALTPGRQREYNLYFSNAKRSSTRTNRIEKYADRILNGKGLRDR